VFLFKASVIYNIRVHAANNLCCIKLVKFVFLSEVSCKVANRHHNHCTGRDHLLTRESWNHRQTDDEG